MADLPTWPFRPDWSSAIIERLTFKTAPLQSITGAGQYVAVRQQPRRSVEARFLLSGAERTHLELRLQRMGSTEHLVPLWFHRATLASGVSAGATTLPCDTVEREFRAGDFAYLVGKDVFSGETVEIASVADDGLTLVDAIASDWPAGSVLHPLRAARFDAGDLDLATNLVSAFACRFEWDAGNDFDGGAETFTVYDGTPVLPWKPNWSENPKRGHTWRIDEFEGDTGLVARLDTAGRAFATTRGSYLLDGRSAQYAFRQMLYRLRGRQKPIWVPGLTADIRVTDAALTGASTLSIARIGLAEVGGVSEDIAHILLSGDLAFKWDGLSAPADPAWERIDLVAPLSRDVAVGERGQFLHFARLDQDTITIRHETDSDGVASATLTWQDCDRSRDGSADGFHTIPDAEMTEGGCGDCGDTDPGDGGGVDPDPTWVQVGWVRRYMDPTPGSIPAGSDTGAATYVESTTQHYTLPAPWTLNTRDESAMDAIENNPYPVLAQVGNETAPWPDDDALVTLMWQNGYGTHYERWVLDTDDLSTTADVPVRRTFRYIESYGSPNDVYEKHENTEHYVYAAIYDTQAPE